MDELSLNLMDLVENSLKAGADLVEIGIREDLAADRMDVSITDNGSGMSPEALAKAVDPFYTTRTTRRIGLGLSLMKASAEAWDGGLELSSTLGKGTELHFWFRLSHIDRQPMGDWPGTLMGLIMSRPGVAFKYRHQVENDDFEMDTRDLEAELGQGSLQSPQVIGLLEAQVREALAQIGSVA